MRSDNFDDVSEHDIKQNQCLNPRAGKVGKCWLDAKSWAQSNNSIDLVSLCISRGGLPRSMRTCDRAASDSTDIAQVSALTAQMCDTHDNNNYHSWSKHEKLKSEFSACCGAKREMKCDDLVSTAAFCTDPKNAKPRNVIRVYCRGIPAEKCCGLGNWENRGHETQNCYGGVCRIDASNVVDKDKACVDAGGWFKDEEGQTCAEEFRSINRLLAEGKQCSDKVPWGGHKIQDEVNGKMGWIKDQCCSESAYKCSASSSGGSSSICKVPSKQAPVREVRCGDTTPELCCKIGGACQEVHQHPGSNSACSSSSTTKGPMGYCRLNIWNFNPESDLQTMCTDTLKGRIDSAGDCNDHHWWKYSNVCQRRALFTLPTRSLPCHLGNGTAQANKMV